MRSARNSLVVALPYTLLIIGSRLAGFDSNLEEAAMDLGADYPTTRRSLVYAYSPGHGLCMTDGIYRLL